MGKNLPFTLRQCVWEGGFKRIPQELCDHVFFLMEVFAVETEAMEEFPLDDEWGGGRGVETNPQECCDIFLFLEVFAVETEIMEEIPLHDAGGGGRRDETNPQGCCEVFSGGVTIHCRTCKIYSTSRKERIALHAVLPDIFGIASRIYTSSEVEIEE